MNYVSISAKNDESDQLLTSHNPGSLRQVFYPTLNTTFHKHFNYVKQASHEDLHGKLTLKELIFNIVLQEI